MSAQKSYWTVKQFMDKDGNDILVTRTGETRRNWPMDKPSPVYRWACPDCGMAVDELTTPHHRRYAQCVACTKQRLDEERTRKQRTRQQNREQIERDILLEQPLSLKYLLQMWPMATSEFARKVRVEYEDVKRWCKGLPVDPNVVDIPRLEHVLHHYFGIAQLNLIEEFAYLEGQPYTAYPHPTRVLVKRGGYRRRMPILEARAIAEAYLIGMATADYPSLDEHVLLGWRSQTKT